jgi:ubiquinone/menaquinone biosynthesis C-methylase UbiE
MTSSTNPTTIYYDVFAEREWLRLTNPTDGAVEWLVNSRTIESYLPPGPCRILDIGGGPGRYAIWLAKLGHQVVLADLSPKLLSIAREKIAESGDQLHIEIVEANAIDLSRWADDSFDVVLSMGPFYHLVDQSERDKAVKELQRVLRNGGIACIALMPPNAFFRRTIALPDESHHFADPEWVSRLVNEGHFTNEVPNRFSLGAAMKPSEIATYFESFGFRTLQLLSSESILQGMQHRLIELEEENLPAYEAAVSLVLKAASNSDILGMASHLLYVSRNG